MPARDRVIARIQTEAGSLAVAVIMLATAFMAGTAEQASRA
ncbi:MAG TPA: hypothetical protein VH684_25490 [Xanthobacteraceae bacterium]